MFRVLGVFAGAVVAMGVLSGCHGRYDDRFVYHPRPLTVETLAPERAEAGPVRSLVTVVGVRRRDREAELPASVHVRLRLDNTSEAVAEFDPHSIQLFGADVREFPPPILRPEEPLTLEPDDTVTVDAFFPMPGDKIPGEMDLGGLGVRWIVLVDGEEAPGSATFARRELPSHYYQPRGPRFHFGVGAYRRF